VDSAGDLIYQERLRYLKGPDTIGKNEPPVLTPLFYSKDKRLFHSKNFRGNSKR
jgi:hypothetical protein